MIPPGPDQYQQSPHDEHWYSHGTFQEPVQVASVHAFNSSHHPLYDHWVGKIEPYDEIQAQQLPSARVETL
jgi:hypothetical protein